jgi:5-methylcytosine-specific restriction protein A
MAKRPCARVGCASLVVSGYCDGCKAKGAGKETRPSAAVRGYGRTWQVQRLWYLRSHPFCVDPYGAHGERLELATVVDHIVPHKGDPELFRAPENRQGLCKACHDRKTVLEDGGLGRKPRGMKEMAARTGGG